MDMEWSTQDFYRSLVNEYDKKFDRSGVKGERLAARLAQLAEIGLTADGGVNRIAFSPEERRAKELVKKWMQEAGLSVSEDGAGNVIGRIEGKEDKETVIMSGSHVDSVPNGGHFDGPLGVLAALEVAEAWKSEGYEPLKSYEAVIFTDEEGARFNGGLTGSRAMTGEFDLAKQMKMKDVEGTPFEAVAASAGLDPQGFEKARRNLGNVAAFIEVHIEQGKRLEKEDLPVGVVTGIAGPCWLEVEFSGEAGHAGNTPMDQRHDALTAVSEFILQVESLPPESSSTAVATVGKLQVEPNGVNVIPGKVRLSVDVRDIEEKTRDELVGLITGKAEEIAGKRKVKAAINETLTVQPVPVTEELQTAASKSVEEALSIRPFHLPSGAGHDAMIMGRYVPMAMLFTRSKAGISHNPAEWSSLSDCIAAVHVLKRLVERLMEE
ncbi:Zn-dependent hydrolase [Bacillus marinisedimentorum]|uniref:Zn-dependent hydrolase n=1 Tax=Bacillus marinisedimentorum TaxID=1821260 RepID=UPI0007E2A525|nr:Zn-dependent hydrolase [Bacillus marinisedimentorum]